MSSSKPQLNLPPSTQSGFTIIECLLAIIIVSLLMAAVAPVLALSVATRVQSRRVELATAAAKAYLDGVRSGSIVAPNIITTQTLSADALKAPDASSLTCQNNRGYCTTPTNVYCINFDNATCDNKSLRALIIQPIAYNPKLNGFVPSNSDPVKANQEKAQKGYQLAVRVYRADAFNGTSLKTAVKDSQRVAASFTGGLGNKEAPLVEMKTEIVAQGTGSTGTQFIDLCKRIFFTQKPTGTAADANTACPPQGG